MATVTPDFTYGAHVPNMAAVLVASEPSEANASDPMGTSNMAPPAMYIMRKRLEGYGFDSQSDTFYPGIFYYYL